MVSTQDIDELVLSGMIKDTNVLNTKEYTKWNWNLIFSILQVRIVEGEGESDRGPLWVEEGGGGATVDRGPLWVEEGGGESDRGPLWVEEGGGEPLWIEDLCGWRREWGEVDRGPLWVDLFHFHLPLPSSTPL